MTAKKRKTRAQSKRKILERRWQSYTGTGINAKKGNDAIVLREKLGGGQFAVIKLFGGCWSNSPMRVLREINTSSFKEAESCFNETVKRLGYNKKPVRTAGVGITFP